MAVTLADVLGDMTVFDNGLQTGSGAQDEARAIRACNIAQHYFEIMAATMPRVLQSTINVATTANVETTTWTSTLLRLDAIWLLDATTSLPTRKLKRIEEIGGHVPSLPWPLQLSLASGVGTPGGYYANQNNFYWLPLPDGTNTLRIYGFVEAPEFVSRSSSFTYPLRVKAAIAAFAVKLLKSSTDDDESSNDSLASAIFGPLLKGMKSFDRSEPHGRYYGEVHDT